MSRILSLIDRLTESNSRALATGASRRSLLAHMGRMALGAAIALPVLPFDRTSRAHAAGASPAGASGKKKKLGETDCDYWKYCSVDGFLCSCCGGSSTTCPPGTSPSAVTWVGTCHNPADGRDYLVSYNDCCGKTSCGRCFCNTNHGDRPGYRLGVHNDINWCMSNDSSMYHCTVSIIVGVTEKE